MMISATYNAVLRARPLEWCRLSARTVMGLAKALRTNSLVNNPNSEKLLEKLNYLKGRVRDPVKSCWDDNCCLFQEFARYVYFEDLEKKRP